MNPPDPTGRGTLRAEHLEHLRASGLSDETIATARITSIYEGARISVSRDAKRKQNVYALRGELPSAAAADEDAETPAASNPGDGKRAFAS